MTIQANVEGVGTLQFPDGTDPAIIKATVQKQIAAKQSAAPAGGAAAQPGFPFSSVSTLKPGNRLPKLDAPEVGDAKKDWKEGLTFYDNVALDNTDNLREKQVPECRLRREKRQNRHRRLNCGHEGWQVGLRDRPEQAEIRSCRDHRGDPHHDRHGDRG